MPARTGKRKAAKPGHSRARKGSFGAGSVKSGKTIEELATG